MRDGEKKQEKSQSGIKDHFIAEDKTRLKFNCRKFNCSEEIIERKLVGDE